MHAHDGFRYGFDGGGSMYAQDVTLLHICILAK
jgi:hypothetical protein